MKRRFQPLIHRIANRICYTALVAIIIPVVLEFAAFVGWSIHDWTHSQPHDNLARTSPAYAKYPWAEKFWNEEESRWKSQRGSYVPFLVWGIATWHGTYVNTDHTVMGDLRRTINPPNFECKDAKKTSIWIFGGSTVYGTGVPDSATLPSFLSRELNADGRSCVEVTNLGVEGYVTNQELMLLLDQLKSGRHPDGVVFYDGVNDSYAGTISPAVPGAHLSLDRIRARVEGALAARVDFLGNSYLVRTARSVLSVFHRSGSSQLQNGDSSEKAAETLNVYEENLGVLQALAEAYRFKLYAFWQPALIYGHKPLAPFEQQMVNQHPEQLDASANDREFRAWTAVYEEAERRSADKRNFVFLGDIFDGMKEPLYIDQWMHLDPEGNELVARAIANSIADSLRLPRRR